MSAIVNVFLCIILFNPHNNPAVIAILIAGLADEDIDAQKAEDISTLASLALNTTVLVTNKCFSGKWIIYNCLSLWVELLGGTKIQNLRSIRS